MPSVSVRFLNSLVVLIVASGALSLSEPYIRSDAALQRMASSGRFPSGSVTPKPYNCSVYGWAKDADSSTSIAIEAYRGAPYEGRGILVAETKASLLRSDGLPGFLLQLPRGFDDLLYVYAVGVNSFGEPDGQRTRLAPSVKSSRQLTCDEGPDQDEGPRYLDFRSSLGFTAVLGPIETVVRQGDAGIVGGAPDGHISVDVVDGLSRMFFSCYSDRQLSCVGHSKSGSFSDIRGLYRAADGKFRTVMDGGEAGDPYESKYAAINSTWYDSRTGVTHAWYHAEVFVNPNDCPNSAFYASVGYATSTDGGRSFVKKGIVVTSPYPLEPSHCFGQGAALPKVIELGDYLYMVFDTAGPSTRDFTDGVSLARASKTMPTVWFKYFNGGFTEPGMGGRFTPIVARGGAGPCNNLWGASVIWNAFLRQFVMLHMNFCAEGSIFIRTSFDLITWSPAQLLMPSSVNWRYRYPTLVDRTDDTMAQTGWLYFGRDHKSGSIGIDTLLRRRGIAFYR